MKTGIGALGATLMLVVATGCQAPSDTAGPPVSGAPFPGESLVAPAIEPEPSGPESPLGTLPPGEPVAPAIEPGFVTPEPTIEFDPG
jgi:hypothetical protein